MKAAPCNGKIAIDMRIALPVSLMFFAHLTLAHVPGSDFILREKMAKQQLVLLWDQPIDSTSLKRFFKQKNVTIQNVGRRFVSFIPRDGQAKALPQSFWMGLQQRFPGFKIKHDRLMITSSDDCKSHDTVAELIGASKAFVSQSASVDSCSLAPRCNGQNVAWARFVLGADLADKIVESSLNAHSPEKRDGARARVAAVDTGFDGSQSGALATKAFKSAKGFDGAGSTEKDEDGHGSWVLGMIGGETVGVSANLKLASYRVTKDDTGGTANASDIATAVEKACRENDVVNLSWGNILDELGAERYDAAEWYALAEKEGCLVTIAAGNSGIKENKRETVPTYANVTYVGATNDLQKDASFSTAGEIYAPGESVFSIKSQQSLPDKDRDSCRIGSVELSSTSGTSFSSPATAGIKGQIITILRARGQLPQNPMRKAALVKGILLASQQWSQENGLPKSANALFAAKLASIVSEPGAPLNPSALVDLGNRSLQSFCASATSCKESNDDNKMACEEKKACVNSLRERLLLCKAFPEDQANRLMKLLKSMGENDLMVQASRRSPSGQEEVENALEASWMANLRSDHWGRTARSPTRAIDLLAEAANANLSNFLTAEKAREVVKSSGSEDVLGGHKNSLLNSSKLKYAQKFRTLIQSMNNDERANLISVLSQLDPLDRSRIVFLYQMSMISDSLPKEQRDTIDRMIAETQKIWLSPSAKNRDGYFPPETLEALAKTMNTSRRDEILSSASKGKIEDQYSQAYRTILNSEDISEDKKRKLAVAIVQSPGNIDYETLGSAIGKVMENGTAQDANLVKRLLITRPDADVRASDLTLPSHCDLICQKTVAPSGRTNLTSDVQFWKDYTSLQVREYLKNFGGSEGHLEPSSFYLDRILIPFGDRVRMPDNQKQSLFQELKPPLIEKFQTAIRSLNDNGFLGLDSRWLIEGVAKNAKTIQALGGNDFISGLRQAREQLKDTKDRELTELRQEINRSLAELDPT